MNRNMLQYEIPPKPELKPDDFEGGITTRLMAKRKSSTDESRRVSLNFPPGSFIPNSNVLLVHDKSQIHAEDTKSASGSGITVSNLVAYREEHPEKSTMSETPTSSESPLQKIRESVRKRSLSSTRNSVSTQKTEQNEAEKTMRRISLRTAKMNVAEVRKPSPESLKKSIDNSEQEVELLDVDELANGERRGSRKNSSPRVSFKNEELGEAFNFEGQHPDT